MSRSKLLPYVLTAALTIVPACGGDDDNGSAGPSGSTLTAVEFESMVEALSVIGSLGIGIIGLDRTSPNLAAQTQTITVPATTTDCPAGGTSTYSGTYTFTSNAQGLSSFHYVLTQGYTNCRAQSSNGTTWSFNGNPNITVTFDYTVSQAGNYSYTVREVGGFAYSGAGKGNTCQIDVTMTGTINASATAYTYTYVGTVCGQSVNETYTG